MSEAKVITATAENPNQPVAGIPYPPVQGTIVEERRERKRKLTAAFGCLAG